MKQAIMIALLACALAGCQTKYTAVEQGEDDAKCRNVGHEVGSIGYNDCMALNFAMRDRQTQQQNQALAAVAIGALAVSTVALAANAPAYRRPYWCSPYTNRCYY